MGASLLTVHEMQAKNSKRAVTRNRAAFLTLVYYQVGLITAYCLR